MMIPRYCPVVVASPLTSVFLSNSGKFSGNIIFFINIPSVFTKNIFIETCPKTVFIVIDACPEMASRSSN